MIAIFDEDGGGDVDFQEFVSGLSAFSSKGNKEEKLRFAFKVYDIDRDGYISNGELFIVLKMMVGSNLKDQQLQQIVDKTIMEADLDRDGKISFEEFTRMVENTDVSMSMTLGMCKKITHSTNVREARADMWQINSSGEMRYPRAWRGVRRHRRTTGNGMGTAVSVYTFHQDERLHFSGCSLRRSLKPAFFSQPSMTCVWSAPGPATESACLKSSTIRSDSRECVPLWSMTSRAIFMSFSNRDSWYPDWWRRVSP